ncbi:MAG: helix-turn-helix transcriptional regulator [Clostridia bacterium]|nr:helix-turn-helix transcriptional regulator [Clostridia bacterium]
MQAYYEKEALLFSKNKIKCFKNTVNFPKTMVSPHWHDAYEILYVRSGFGDQQINRQSFHFQPGTVVVICPGEIHSTVATSPEGCDIDVLQFVAESFDSKRNLLNDLVSSVIPRPPEQARQLFDSLNGHIGGEKTSGELILLGNVFILCGLLSEYCGNPEAMKKNTEFFDNVYRYIRNTDDLRLKSVAGHFGYSHEHFSKKFHAEFGISYKYYCERVKMQRILEYFDVESVSLTEIAYMLGYSDTSSFIRAFKRIYGITPNTYRKLKRL